MLKTEEPKLTTNPHLIAWVQEMAELCRPDAVVWCDGSDAEKKRLTQEAIATGEVTELNQEKLPGCLYHRSNLNDVARTEHLTFICTRQKDDAGHTNNWMDPKEAYEKLGGIFKGSMKGRKLYVIPFIMGPVGAPSSKIGVQISDSIYEIGRA